MTPSQIIAALLRNPHYKLASLAMAVMLWLYVQGEQVVDGVVRASVDWVRPPGLVAVEPIPEAVSVAVRGSRSAIRRAARAEISITADISSLDVGAHLVDLSAYEIQGTPAGIAVTRLSPASVSFTLDELTARKVVVDPLLVGEPADGFHVVSALPNPLVVSIRGPRVLIQDRVDVPTRAIDVTGLSGDATVAVRLDLPHGVERVADEPLEVVIDMEAEFQTRVFTEVPVVVWPPSEQAWLATPETVTVELEGAAGSLAAIAPSEVVVFVDVLDPTTPETVTARFAGREGVLMRVLYGAGSEVSVAGITPETVEVKRR